MILKNIKVTIFEANLFLKSQYSPLWLVDNVALSFLLTEFIRFNGKELLLKLPDRAHLNMSKMIVGYLLKTQKIMVLSRFPHSAPLNSQELVVTNIHVDRVRMLWHCFWQPWSVGFNHYRKMTELIHEVVWDGYVRQPSKVELCLWEWWVLYKPQHGQMQV